MFFFFENKSKIHHIHFISTLLSIFISVFQKQKNTYFENTAYSVLYVFAAAATAIATTANANACLTRNISIFFLFFL